MCVCIPGIKVPLLRTVAAGSPMACSKDSIQPSRLVETMNYAVIGRGT